MVNPVLVLILVLFADLNDTLQSLCLKLSEDTVLLWTYDRLIKLWDLNKNCQSLNFPLRVTLATATAIFSGLTEYLFWLSSSIFTCLRSFASSLFSLHSESSFLFMSSACDSRMYSSLFEWQAIDPLSLGRTVEMFYDCDTWEIGSNPRVFSLNAFPRSSTCEDDIAVTLFVRKITPLFSDYKLPATDAAFTLLTSNSLLSFVWRRKSLVRYNSSWIYSDFLCMEYLLLKSPSVARFIRESLPILLSLSCWSEDGGSSSRFPTDL